MPTLLETISEYDNDLLLMIAEGWGMDLEIAPHQDLAKQLSALVSRGELVAEMVSALGGAPRQALANLMMQEGKIAWDQFERDYGEMREMGAGRRDRERPDRSPVSVTEMLFYKAFIGRAFFETKQGLRELAFIPDEFYQILEPFLKQSESLLPPFIDDQKVAKVLLTNDFLVDDACTYLAGMRSNFSEDKLSGYLPQNAVPLLKSLLMGAGILSGDGKPSAEKVKEFLKSSRGFALTRLAQSWISDPVLDELKFIDTLEFEGTRKSNPKFSRSLVLEMINFLPDDQWFDINAFFLWVQKNHPDLLRSGGEYDAWFVKDKAAGIYINGFENWLLVEGIYLRTMFLKFLFRLGFVDLGKSKGNSEPVFFRKSKWFKNLYSGQTLEYPAINKSFFDLEKSGEIIVDRYFPRETRYQIARCCDWNINRGHKFFYSLSLGALRNMEKQGLKVAILIALIKRYAKKPVPQNILDALVGWEAKGEEATFFKSLLLTVQSEQVLERLIASSGKKYILSRLNSTTAVVEPASAPFIRAALLEMGILAEIKPDI